MNFEMNQLVKSADTNGEITVYRIINIEYNLYTVEDTADGEIGVGCDDDFVALKTSDPVYSKWIDSHFK